MPDPSSQANELRLLEQKRLRSGLSSEEEARRVALKDAVPAPRTLGFDVNAAAAEVRALLDTAEPEPSPAALEPVVPRTEPTARPEPEAPTAEAFATLEPPTASPDAPIQLEPEAPGGHTVPAASLDDVGAKEPVPAAAAPVYDAADYGLDPNDPNAVAWASWYAAQGWDPATAYAYAQRLNAPAEEGTSGAAAPAEEALSPAEEALSPAEEAIATQEEAIATQEEAIAPPVDAFPFPTATAAEPAQAAPSFAEAAAAPPSSAAPAEEIGIAGAIGEAADATGMPEAVAPLVEEIATSDGMASPHAVATLDALPGARVVDTMEGPDEPIASPRGATDVPTRMENAVGLAGTQPQDAAASPEGQPGEVAIPDLPPLELEVLDGAVPAQEQSVAPEQDVPIDLGPAFDTEAAAHDGTQPDGVTSSLQDLAGAALGPELGWAEHAVPASDEPVDFTVFNAEPAAVEPALTARAAGPSDSLELPPPEPLEVGDEDILEVGEDVVEVDEAEPTPTRAVVGPWPISTTEPFPAPAEPSSTPVAPSATAHDAPWEPEPAPSRLDAPSAVEPGEAASQESDEPTLAFGPAAAAETEGDDLELAPLVAAGSAPAAPAAEPEPLPLPDSFVPGTHRVVIHTADGQVRRGTVTDVALDAGELHLSPQGGRAGEAISVEQIKAIFFMLPHGQAPAEPVGKTVRVTFRDGRQVAGFSADYAPERPGFFMVPADTRTHTARIWVYRSAVRQVAVS